MKMIAECNPGPPIASDTTLMLEAIAFNNSRRPT